MDINFKMVLPVKVIANFITVKLKFNQMLCNQHKQYDHFNIYFKKGEGTSFMI